MLRVKFFVESGEVVDETFKADGELMMQKEFITEDVQMARRIRLEADVTAKRIEAVSDPEHYFMPGRDGRNG